MRDDRYPRVPVADAVAWLAAHEPGEMGGLFIDGLQEGLFEAIWRDGQIAVRITEKGRRAPREWGKEP